MNPIRPRAVPGDIAMRRHLSPSCAAFAALALSAAASAAGEPFRIAPGDSLSVSIYGQPDLSGVHRVREDGVVALHLVGEVPVAGLSAREAGLALEAAAEAAFQGSASVIVDFAAYADVYVVGDVGRPGAYAFTPGLTVVKALALAGDGARSETAGAVSETRVNDERRLLLTAQMRSQQAQAAIGAIDAELARLDGAAPPPAVPPEAAEAVALQERLIGSRREVLESALEGAARQKALAAEEADLLRQRGEIVARQLAATEAVLRDIDSLVARGLARRERQQELAVDVDDFRRDSLDVAAFEARARQTAANAESAAAVATNRYREALVEERIAAVRALETATIDFATSLEFLQQYGSPADIAPALGPIERRFEIIRGDETSAAEEKTPLRPRDVLRVTMVMPEAAPSR
jgi:protein involved in polysaccharide export with SLBB domain